MIDRNANMYGCLRGSRVVRSVDPGNKTGFAYFTDGKLHGAHVAWWQGPDGIDRTGFGTMKTVVEVPDRVVKDPISILKLALKAGMLLERFDGIPVTATGWKAQVPKELMCRRILAHLKPEEIAVLPKNKSKLGYDHNMLDAVGLGLFALGRMARGGRMR